MHVAEHKIDSKVIQELATSMKFLGFQWSGNARNIAFNVKNKLLHLSPLTIKRKTHHFADLFGVRGRHILSLGI